MISVSTILVMLEVLLMGVIAAVVVAGATAFYRSRFDESLPEAVSLLIGLGTIAMILNTRLVFVQFLSDNAEVVWETAVRNVATFGMAAVGSFVGHSTGDRLGQSAYLQLRGLQPSISPIVRATGRYITVTLPEDIEDIEGYDPVSPEVKEAISGKEFDFPRGLTVEQLQDQVVTALTEKHDIGYVDVDIESDGRVPYLALGQRPAGLGPTLPPGSVAFAIRADPAFSAAAGDTVEIWEPGPEPARIGVAELRGSVGDVATLACDASLSNQIDPNTTYRLVTLPVDARPDREFAAMLRHSLETLGVLEINEGSELVGRALQDLDVTAIAIQRGGSTLTIPKPNETVEPGDQLFVLSRPDRLRALESMDGVRSVPADELEGGRPEPTKYSAWRPRRR